MFTDREYRRMTGFHSRSEAAAVIPRKEPQEAPQERIEST